MRFSFENLRLLDGFRHFMIQVYLSNFQTAISFHEQFISIHALDDKLDFPQSNNLYNKGFDPKSTKGGNIFTFSGSEAQPRYRHPQGQRSGFQQHCFTLPPTRRQLPELGPKKYDIPATWVPKMNRFNRCNTKPGIPGVARAKGS